MPVEWIDPVPAIRFEGGPLACEIIGTSRFGDELTLYIRVPSDDGFIVYLVTVTSSYRDLRWQRT